MTFRLIKRASNDDDSNANRDRLIDFKFIKSDTNDTTGQYYFQAVDYIRIINIILVYALVFIVEVNVNSIEVLVDLPFILTLKDFAMESIKPLTAPDENDKTAESESIEVEDAGTLPSPTPVSPATSEVFSPVLSEEVPPTKSTGESASQGRITIKAKIKKPLIALVEDAEDRDSRALVLSVSNPYLCALYECQSLVIIWCTISYVIVYFSQTDSVAFNMRSRGSNVNINSSISSLLISSSTADNLKNTANNVYNDLMCVYLLYMCTSALCLSLYYKQVLAPTNGPISATFDAFDKSSTEIDVQVPPLAFTFSPTTVRLILKMVNSLQPDSKARTLLEPFTFIHTKCIMSCCSCMIKKAWSSLSTTNQERIIN